MRLSTRAARGAFAIGLLMVVLVGPTACNATGKATTTHQYADVDDTVVWLIARHDAPVLHAECAALLKELGD